MATQIEILERAERLAAVLAGGPAPVNKNVLLSVVADFMSDPSPDPARLRKMLRLLETGNGGHLKRGGNYGRQVRAVVEEIGRLLDRGGLRPEEYKTLFGWTARLLLVRREKSSTPSRETRGGTRPPSDRRSRPEDRRPSTPPTPPPNLGAVSQKGLGDLLKLKQQLEEKEKGGKK